MSGCFFLKHGVQYLTIHCGTDLHYKDHLNQFGYFHLTREHDRRTEVPLHIVLACSDSYSDTVIPHLLFPNSFSSLSASSTEDRIL